MKRTIDYTEQALREEPPADPAPFLNCLNLWKAGKYRDLESCALEAIEKKADIGWGSFFLGLSRFHTERYEQAYLDMAPCLGEGKRGAIAHHYAGQLTGRRGTATNNAAAREHFRRSTAIFPDWVESLVFLGQYCYYTMAIDEAVTALTHALELEPDNSLADFYLVSVLGMDGRYESVRSYLESKKQIHPAFQEDFQKLRDEAPLTPKKVKFARYPDHSLMADRFTDAVKKAVLSDLNDVEPFISPTTKFFTIGSCFASNLANALTKKGYDCTNLRVGETVNTTFANKLILDWVLGLLPSSYDARMKELLGDINRVATIEKIRQADVLIYTLGVAPCFFDRKTGDFVLPKASELNSRALAGNYQFRTTTVEENTRNLNALIDNIKKLNPTIRMFISVSPVPLRATFERNASVVADCLSKSILRVTAETIIQTRKDDVHYWPSFEIFRWMGGHVGPFYGTDDGCSLHVSESLVDQTIGFFLELFTAPREELQRAG